MARNTTTGAHLGETDRGRSHTLPRLAELFEARVARGALQTGRMDTPCNIWLGAVVHNTGYGQLSTTTLTGDPAKVYGHWAAYRLGRLDGGPLPAYHADGRMVVVSHRCDVKLCVNPEHLYLGDGHSNDHDWRVRGREDEVTKVITYWIRANPERKFAVVPPALRRAMCLPFDRVWAEVG